MSRRLVLHVCLMLALLPLAAVRSALADPPIDESGNFTTVTVSPGQTITSTNATAAITLGGGLISNAGTVENTSPSGTAILVEDGAAVENLATGTITGNLVFQAQSGGGSSLDNDGLVNGTAAFNTVGTGRAFVVNVGTFNGNGDLAITIAGASSDGVVLAGGSAMTGQILMGGSSLGDDDDDDDDDEDSVDIDAGATLTTVAAGAAISMGSGRVNNAGTIDAANAAIVFSDTGSDGFRRSVTNSGTIGTSSGAGIADDSSSSISFELFNGGSITASSTAVDIGRSFNPFQSTATIVIDNATIAGDRVLSGQFGVEIDGNTQVQVNNAGRIEGQLGFGLRINSQANDFVGHSITNDGTIAGLFGSGVEVFHSTVDGDDDDDDDDQGVTGELILANSGSITGDSGVTVGGDIGAQITNSGAIGGNGRGRLLGDDDDDDDDDGGRGVFIATRDPHGGLTHTVNNTGLIDGNTAGVQVEAIGQQLSSVQITNGGEILPEDIEAPTIRGGVGVLVTGDTDTTIRNFGVIAGGDGDDDDDDDDDDGILTGVGVGVVADSFEPTSHFLGNEGSITGQGAGAAFLSDESLRFDPFQGTNDVKMTVTVRNGDAFLPASLQPLVSAQPTIAGDGFGLLFAGNVEARVTNSGLIAGGDAGIGVFADGTDAHLHVIDNSGTIRSDFDPGVEVVDQTSNGASASALVLTNSGLIEGRTGVALSGSLAIDITNSGTIRALDGDDDDDDDGIAFEVGSGFALDHRIVNTGTIEASGDAISGFTSTGTASTFTIDNQGSITGDSGIDVFTDNFALDITNSGTIRATAEGGIGIDVSQGDDDDDDDDDGQPVNIVNTGTIVADAPGGAAIRYRGSADLNVTSSGILTATDNFAVDASGGNDTINLESGSLTTGSIDGNGGDDALNLDGAGQLTGDVFDVEDITKTGEGAFTVQGNMNNNDGDPFGLSVLGGTLEITPGSNEIVRPRALTGEVTNADVFVTNGATLLVQDGAHLQVNDLDVNGGGHLVIGSGGAGARVDDGTGTTETTAAFSGGASFTVNQNSELDVRDLEMTDSSGIVAGTATVSNSLTMINSAIHVTETGIFSALNDIFLENSTLTVDEGGQITGIDVIEYTGSEVTVNGTQGGSVLLGAGSTLKGKGTILGNAILLSGAKLAPGNSPDTITIGGNLVLNAGTTTEIELTRTENDRVNVGGTATLGGTLEIIQLESLAALRSSKTFTIVDAPNNPIQGAFAAINGTFVRPTISLQAVQNTNSFQLVFTRNLFQTFQQSANELAVGRNLDLYMAGTSTALDPLVTALDGLTTNQQVSDSLDKLHPEVFDSLPQVGFQHAQQLAGQMEQYLYTARLNLKANPAVRGTPAPAATAGKLGAIAPSVAAGSMVPDAGVNGFTSSGARYGGFGYAYSFEVDQDSQRNGLGALVRTGSETKDRGVITGVDKRVNDETVVGMTFGVGSVDSLFRDGRGSSDGDVRQVGAYATWLREDKYLDAMLAYQAYDFTTLRIVDIPGFLNRLRSSQDIDGLTAYVGGGWMRQSGDWQWGPTASLQWTQLDVNGFTETGGIAALTVAGREIDSLRSTLGVRATRKYQYGDTCQVVPELRLRWSHEFANDDRAVVANFAGAPLAAFTAEAARPDRNTVLAGASVNAYFKKDLSVFANYDTELGRDGANVHAGRGGVALKF